MGTRSFPGVKRPGRGVDHSLSSSAKVKERVELYIYSPSGPSWSVWGELYHLILKYTTTHKRKKESERKKERRKESNKKNRTTAAAATIAGTTTTTMTTTTTTTS